MGGITGTDVNGNEIDYFDDDNSDYLTMARHMREEWNKWTKNPNNAYPRMTGAEQIYSKNAFQDGFMAGFYARFFKQTDN